MTADDNLSKIGLKTWAVACEGWGPVTKGSLLCPNPLAGLSTHHLNEEMFAYSPRTNLLAVLRAVAEKRQGSDVADGVRLPLSFHGGRCSIKSIQWLPPMTESDSFWNDVIQAIVKSESITPPHKLRRTLSLQSNSIDSSLSSVWSDRSLSPAGSLTLSMELDSAELMADSRACRVSESAVGDIHSAALMSHGLTIRPEATTISTGGLPNPRSPTAYHLDLSGTGALQGSPATFDLSTLTPNSPAGQATSNHMSWDADESSNCADTAALAGVKADRVASDAAGSASVSAVAHGTAEPYLTDIHAGCVLSAVAAANSSSSDSELAQVEREIGTYSPASQLQTLAMEDVRLLAPDEDRSKAFENHCCAVFRPQTQARLDARDAPLPRNRQQILGHAVSVICKKLYRAVAHGIAEPQAEDLPQLPQLLVHASDFLENLEDPPQTKYSEDDFIRCLATIAKDAS